MAQTYGILHDAFPAVLADLIFSYFYPKHSNSLCLGAAGCFEACMNVEDPISAIEGAAASGHIIVVDMLLDKILAPALSAACASNNETMAFFLISRGAH